MKNILLSKCSNSCIGKAGKPTGRRLLKGGSDQILRIMKLTAILILVAFMQISAKEGFSQNVTLNETNSNLDKVLMKLENKQIMIFFTTRGC